MNSAKENTPAVATLCRVLKANFGAQATEEALRHVAVSPGIAQRDIADTWADVLQELKQAQ